MTHIYQLPATLVEMLQWMANDDANYSANELRGMAKKLLGKIRPLPKVEILPAQLKQEEQAFVRVHRWIANGMQKPPELAFTEGLERNMARLAWMARKTPPVSGEAAQEALRAFKAVLDDYNHGIYGNRTYQDNQRDIEKIRAVLQLAAGGCEMKERPIPFSGPMVRAILDGRKTQTRRVVKPRSWADKCHIANEEYGVTFGKCPYGQPGDRLWVREAWQALAEYDHLKPSKIPQGTDVLYNADHPDMPWNSRKRNLRFMPRKFSRITLEITGIRVERLNDISDVDVIAEGVRDLGDGVGELDMLYGLQKALFKNLWQSVNGPDSWAANPWVWVIEFKRLENGGK